MQLFQTKFPHDEGCPDYLSIKKGTFLQHAQGSSDFEPIGAFSFIQLFRKWTVKNYKLIPPENLKSCKLCNKDYGSVWKDLIIGGHMTILIDGKNIEILITFNCNCKYLDNL